MKIANKTFFLLYLIFFLNYIFNKSNNFPKKFKHPISLTTSIIIPSHSKHIQYLYDLLKNLTAQTSIPNEVVISISGINPENILIINDIEQEKWPFVLRIIKTSKENSASENRNIACQNATKDIIICQDADDLIHPQRVQIVKYFFEKYDIVHLLHGISSEFMDYKDFSNIRHINLKNGFGSIFKIGMSVANGFPCFRKKLFKYIQYNTSISLGEDINFNSMVYQQYPHKTLVIFAQLMNYRSELSASKKRNLEIFYRNIFRNIISDKTCECLSF